MMVDWLKIVWVRFVQWWTVSKVAVALLVFGILAGVGGSLYNANTFREFIEGIYANASTELISIAITVLLIDSLYQRRQTEQSGARLIREMSSSDQGIALRAVRELWEYGWVDDGHLKGAYLAKASLQGARLMHANMQEANLFQAELEGAQLFQANLQGADLRGASLKKAYLAEANMEKARLYSSRLGSNAQADLRDVIMWNANMQGADVSNAQLIKAKTLKGAVMPDGTRYDGRFKLERDIEYARVYGVDIEEPQAMANFYEISLEEYQRGQEWARENLPKLRGG